jgi:hypothetical protein
MSPGPVRVGLLLLAAFQAGGEAQEPRKPTIMFLDVEAAADAIADESLEPYFALLQPAEMEAKTGEPLLAREIVAQRAECQEYYRRGVRAFSEQEQRALTTLVERLHGAWAGRHPRIAELPWSFLGTEDQIEGGLPHTRGRSIVLPRSVGTAIVASLEAGEAAVREQLQLLVHEQSHVLQRLEPELFAPLYLGWGFLRAPGLEPAAALLPRHVVNPDGVRTEWVFPLKEGRTQVYLHPLVAFRDKPPPHQMPHDFELIAVELTKAGAAFRPKLDARGGLVIRSLPLVTDYHARFGGIFENFHPNEIFAVLFATMVVQDAFGGEGLPQSSQAAGKDFAKLRAWCAKSLTSKSPAAAR